MTGKGKSSFNFAVFFTCDKERGIDFVKPTLQLSLILRLRLDSQAFNAPNRNWPDLTDLRILVHGDKPPVTSHRYLAIQTHVSTLSLELQYIGSGVLFASKSWFATSTISQYHLLSWHSNINTISSIQASSPLHSLAINFARCSSTQEWGCVLLLQGDVLGWCYEGCEVRSATATHLIEALYFHFSYWTPYILWSNKERQDSLWKDSRGSSTAWGWNASWWYRLSSGVCSWLYRRIRGLQISVLHDLVHWCIFDTGKGLICVIPLKH